jgi:hypothetical protein
MSTIPISNAAPEPYMKAPKRVTVKQLEGMIGEWLTKNADQTGKQFFHKQCGGRIVDYDAPMSIHDSGWSGCAGHGEVETHALPRCIECQPVSPPSYGCLHLEEGESAIEKLGGAFQRPALFDDDWKHATLSILTVLAIVFLIFLLVVAGLLIWRYFNLG